MPRTAAPWYRTSTGRWYVTHQGKKRPLPITDPKDQAGAWDAFRALVSQAVTEAVRSPAARPEPVAELVKPYLDAIAHKINARTRRGYESYLRTFVALFGNSAAAQIDPGAVEKGALAAGWSDSNRANYLWAVQAFLRWCGRADVKLSRPAKDSRGAEAVVPPALHARILRETTGDFHQYVRFLWATGCRPMEGARLTVEAVDWVTGTVTLKQHKTRHKKKRRILYLSTEAVAILREQAERHRAGPLFRGLGGRPFSLQAVVSRFCRLSDKLGESVCAYNYRHTFGTRALAVGLPDTHVAALMGHTSTRMLHQHYSHITADARLLREAAEKLAG
jgi:integrase